MKEIAAYWDRVPCGSLHPDPTEQRYFVQPHIRGFAQFERWKGKRILEIGCGIGTDTLEFAKAGADIYAIDLSPKSVEIAFYRALMHKEEYERLPWIHCLNAEEWLPPWEYDLIYSFGVLHHTPHPEKVLVGAHRLLKDDGELRIMLYAKWSIKNLMRQQPEAQAGCPLVKFYSGWQVRKLLWSCGFEVVSIKKTHIFPWRVKDYTEHRYVKAFPWNWTPRWMFSILERLLGHHLLIVARKA